MKSPLADSERARLIAAMLPDVAFDGWSQHALRLAAGRIGMPVGEAMALFPRGAPDINPAAFLGTGPHHSRAVRRCRCAFPRQWYVPVLGRRRASVR